MIKKQIKLLYVDNAHLLLERDTKDLEECGFFVAPYSDGLDALIAIGDGLKYDCAIIDRELFSGNISGEDLMERSKAVYPQIPVICISGYKDKPQKADRLVHKGRVETLKELVEAIEACMSSPEDRILIKQKRKKSLYSKLFGW